MRRRVPFFYLTFTLAFVGCGNVRLPSETRTDLTGRDACVAARVNDLDWRHE